MFECGVDTVSERALPLCYFSCDDDLTWHCREKLQWTSSIPVDLFDVISKFAVFRVRNNCNAHGLVESLRMRTVGGGPGEAKPRNPALNRAHACLVAFIIIAIQLISNE